MPNLRKRSSVLTYNDDAVFKAIENLRRFSKMGKKRSPKPEPVAQGDDQIPEFVYADDGRIFFPCYFCCHAFAYKNDQLAHMQTCPFNVIVKPPPSPPVDFGATPRKVPKLGTFTKGTGLKAMSNIQNGVVMPRKVQKIASKPGGGMQNGFLKMGAKKIKSSALKPSVRKITISKAQFISKLSLTSVIKANTAAAKAKSASISQLPKTKTKAANFKNAKRIVQNLHQRGLNSNVQKLKKTVSKKTQGKAAFPKIRLEPVPGQSAKVKKSKEPTQAGLVQVKQEKHPYERIRISADKLKEYDEMYKSSDMTKCTLCYKPVVKIRWTRHLLTHAEERNHACSVCKKEFGRKDHRDLHEKKHILSLINEYGS